MKNILAVALLLATSAAFPLATPVLAGSSTDALCGPDAPEGYKRPGGYCEQLDQGSLMQPGNDCSYVSKDPLSSLRVTKVMLVADDCYVYEEPVKL
ncbi:MAG TPA: hypothetical protein VGV07_19115 [Devosia sp.]|uniref:hypothetical protein n=1 Tax=Devosia sp. TaxID=1871048 RepID=UPI002DDD10A2|nr:hypothetical protein [Devosia sp.]HEV2517371.1 hypothetical protein [Devosia sp.]